MGRIVISADSHTQLLVDLRPYLPTPLHGAFEDGLREAEALFRAVLNQPEENREARAEALESFILADEISRPFEYEEYARPVPMADRLKVIDEDGVAAEFIVPHMGAYGPPDFMHECTLAYHRWWQDYVSPAPYRFTGSTILNLACEIDQVVAEVSEAYEHGLRAVSMAGNVAMASPDLPMYNATYYYPLWEALHERSMTLVFHPGHGREQPVLGQRGTDPGWDRLQEREAQRGHLKGIAELLFGGVLERYSHLKVGAIEAGQAWVISLLRELDFFARSRPLDTEHKVEMLPSEQWHRQGFTAGFINPADVDARYELGVANLMWGSDYPHVEGTYPHSRTHLAKLFMGVPPSEVDAIVGGNAARCFGFDLDRLATVPAAGLPWPEEDAPGSNRSDVEAEVSR